MSLNEKELKLFKKWLRSHLNYGPVTVIFTKKDGSERVMNCTTNASLVPVIEEKIHVTNTENPIDFPAVKKQKKINEDTMPVYDLESKAWKSFRWDSIKQVRFEL
jgi:hypothetical protein